MIAWNLSGVERVERDVDALHAAVGELGAYLGELRAIGGERQLVERAALQMARERAEQAHDVLAHQRLAAGDAELPHALAMNAAQSRSSSSSVSRSCFGRKVMSSDMQ